MSNQPYVHKEYPKIVHFKDGTDRVVHNEDEYEQAKSDGGADSPAEHGRVETAEPGQKYDNTKDVTGRATSPAVAPTPGAKPQDSVDSVSSAAAQTKPTTTKK